MKVMSGLFSFSIGFVGKMLELSISLCLFVVR